MSEPAPPSQAFNLARWYPGALLPREDGASSALVLVVTILAFLAVGGIFLAGMMIFYGVNPGLTALFSLVFVVQLIVLLVGSSMILAALNVRYRDVKYVIPFIVQIGLFVTPIIYPTTFIPERYRPLLALNPMTGIIDGFRASLFPEQHFDWSLIGTSFLMTALILLAGIWLFRSAEREFADVI